MKEQTLWGLNLLSSAKLFKEFYSYMLALKRVLDLTFKWRDELI